MRLSKLFVFSAIAMSITLFSCSGEDGERGPQGPAGNNGESITGPQGPVGENGSANAITYDLIFDDDPSGKSQFAFGGLTQLSQEVLRDDTILVYFVKGDAESVYLIPGTSLDGTVNIRVLLEAQSLTFNVFDWDGALAGLPEGQVDYVKLVVIENTGTGDESATNDSNGILVHLKTEGVDINDYESVATYFNL